MIGIKHDGAKVRASLLPGLRALAPIADVMQWAVEQKGLSRGKLETRRTAALP